MDKREKIEFILYQMKIMIKKQDYVRLIIISRKINTKNINEKGLEDLKIQYYSYLAIYYTHENQYLENAKCYKEIYEILRKDEELRNKLPQELEFGFNINIDHLLANLVLYTAIASYSIEQSGLVEYINKEYKYELERAPKLLRVVDALRSTELIVTNPAYYEVDNLEIFSKAENKENHKVDFKKQLIQHNLRTVEKYYEKVTIQRLSELFEDPIDQIESELCEMINKKLIVARIDRLHGTISFKTKKSENEVLNEWRVDIHKILDLVDSTCNLINRENELLAVKSATNR